jgi:hypothetical protein
METTPAYTIEQRDGYFILTHKKTGNTAEVYCSGNCWYARNLTLTKPANENRTIAIKRHFVQWFINTQLK